MSNPINHLLSLVPSRYLLLFTSACVLAHTCVCVCPCTHVYVCV